MITVIDMASGELIYSSAAAEVKSPATTHENEIPTPALALQEMQPEITSNTMPPELADIPVATILAKFA